MNQDMITKTYNLFQGSIPLVTATTLCILRYMELTGQTRQNDKEENSNIRIFCEHQLEKFKYVDKDNSLLTLSKSFKSGKQ